MEPENVNPSPGPAVLRAGPAPRFPLSALIGDAPYAADYIHQVRDTTDPRHRDARRDLLRGTATKNWARTVSPTSTRPRLTGRILALITEASWPRRALWCFIWTHPEERGKSPPGRGIPFEEREDLTASQLEQVLADERNRSAPPSTASKAAAARSRALTPGTPSPTPTSLLRSCKRRTIALNRVGDHPFPAI